MACNGSFITLQKLINVFVGPPKEKVARSNRVGNAIKINKVAQFGQLFHLLNYYNRNLGFPVAKYCGECQNA